MMIELPNNHASIFADYLQSRGWEIETIIHEGSIDSIYVARDDNDYLYSLLEALAKELKREITI